MWGDDVELQALSEIYDRAIEIYAYQTESMRTFHEQEKAREPIRLSYHGSSHYNSVVKLGWTLSDSLLQSEPGQVEDSTTDLDLNENSNVMDRQVQLELTKKVI